MHEAEVDNWNPEIYSQCSSLQYNVATKLLRKLNFNAKENILDIGCGDGKITDYLASEITKGKVVGIDKSPNMIAFADKNHAKANLSFQIMDIEKINLKKEFDTVCSFFCLPWVSNKALAFQNIGKVLKDNGKLVVLSALFGEFHIALLNKIVKKPAWENYFKNYRFSFEHMNDMNYKKYATLADINIDPITITPEKYIFQTKEELSNFFLVLVPHVNHLSEKSQKEMFVDDILKEYLKNSSNYTLTIEILKLVGKKASKQLSTTFFESANDLIKQKTDSEKIVSGLAQLIR